MKHECSIVHDLLPLYVEDMVGEETAAFVRGHLDGCGECSARYEALRAGGPAEGGSSQDKEVAPLAFVRVRRKMRKRLLTAAAAAAACVTLLLVLLRYFPVYRAVMVGGTSFYDMKEVSMLVSVGSRKDRTAAQAVLRQADAAFRDCRHTREENEALYGALARYATAADRGAAFTEHTLELLSAHLDEGEGCLWVCYSHAAIDGEGNTVCASSRVPALWRVAKEAGGEWTVTEVKEHP